MMYVCTKCEEEVDMDPVDDKIICPHCSNRAVLKKRPETPRELKAR
jgi:DNA-directed RNA polymerase subunit RPC12/RpoP